VLCAPFAYDCCLCDTFLNESLLNHRAISIFMTTTIVHINVTTMLSFAIFRFYFYCFRFYFYCLVIVFITYPCDL
jgi:hypothetical protein